MTTTKSETETTAAVEIPLDLLNSKTVANNVLPVEVSSAELNEEIQYPDTSLSDEQDKYSGNAIKPISRWFRWGGTGVLALSLLEFGDFIYQRYSENIWLGGAWLAASGIVLLGVSSILWRELSVLRRLRSSQQYRQQAEMLRAENQHGNAVAFCRELARQNHLHNLPGYQHWLEHVEAHHDDSEVLALFSQFVLHPLDEKALQIVMASSSQTALLVAASPLALLDILLVLWRNLKMLRDVASVYQIRPGYFGQIRLIRQILQNMIFAGATELVTELGTDWFSSELTSKLSAKLAQGLGSGLMSARLGINAIQLCRPVALLSREKPKLSQIRRTLIKKLTSTVSHFFTERSAD